MAMEHYDIVIIGAGPAGCNLARLIQTHHRVLLLDGSFHHPKVCAGLLSPDAIRLLRRYRIELPTEIFCDPQLDSVRVIDLHRKVYRHYPRSYVNVDRAAFDRFLLTLVGTNVSILGARCLDISAHSGGYRLRLRTADGSETYVTAHCIVGADGASSIVRHTLFRETDIQKYVSIQQTFVAEGFNPYYSCIFDPATSDSCSWIFFKGNRMVFGGAFAPRGCRAAFEKQKRRLIASGMVDVKAFDSPISTEACLVSRPHFSEGVFLGNKTAFLIGEAAGFISPSSFEGISYALSSGEALAKAINTAQSLGEVIRYYRRRTNSLRFKVKFKCIKRPFMYGKLWRAIIMKSRIGSISKR